MIRTGFPPDARLVLKAIAAISLGASVGAVARWQLSLALNALFPLLPLGTLAANLIGSLVIGAMAGADVEGQARLLLVTGFLGGFTTFSSFSLDTLSLFEKGEGVAALAYVGASVILSLAAALGGLALGRSLF